MSSNHRRTTSLLLVITVCCAAISLLAVARQPAGPPTYFPPRGEWRVQEPAAVGVDKAKLDDAIAFAIAHENPESKDLAVTIPNQFRSEAPYNTLIGPTSHGPAANGLIIRSRLRSLPSGATRPVDMTFSVTKTFLSSVVGVAFDKGQDPQRHRSSRPSAEGCRSLRGPHNAAITWEHLLRQTSDWSGTLWGKPDWADRPPRDRRLSMGKPRAARAREFYKYNDTRINVLALAALYVLKRPLPEVLDQAIMSPIGASSSWHWEATTTHGSRLTASG